MNWTRDGVCVGGSFSPSQGPLPRLGELANWEGWVLPGPDLLSVSPKDGSLGAELTDTVIAWYHRKH